LDQGLVVLWQPPTVLASLVRPSWVRFVPALLTALGVFGTFLGISQGMTNIGTTDTKVLMDGILQLMTGMGNAFDTSLLGLLGAGILMWLIGVGRGLRMKRHATVVAVLDAHARLDSPAIAIDRLAASLSSQSDLQQQQALAALAMEQAAQKVAETMTGLEPRQIGSAVAESLDPRFREMNDALIRMGSELSDIQRLMHEQNEDVLKGLIDEMRVTLFEPITERLDQSASTSREASEAVRALTGELESTVTALAQFQNETMQRLETFSKEMSGTLTTFQQSTEGAMERIASDIQRAVTGSVEAMEAQREAFKASAADATAAFESATDNVSRNLSETSQAVQEQLTSFREVYSARVSEFLQGQHTMLEETLGRQREGLERVVAELNQSITKETQLKDESVRAMNEQLATLREHAQVIEDLSLRLGLHNIEKWSHLEDSAKTVNRGVAQLKREVESLRLGNETLMRSQREQLAAAQQALQGYVQASNEHQQLFYDKADAALVALAQRVAMATENVITAQALVSPSSPRVSS